MFTGIIEERVTVAEAGPRLAVTSRKVVMDSDPGASIAVNGVCLTVIEASAPSKDGAEGLLKFDLSEETLARTSLGALGPGHPVNLERPLSLQSRLGGHMVQGHVDGVAEVLAVKDVRDGRDVQVELPPQLRRYVARKGSIAVDGVSLTVAEVGDGRFRVSLVPFTLDVTSLGTIRPGDRVNLEVDVLAKYVETVVGERP